jgi:hypothetical protein
MDSNRSVLLAAVVFVVVLVGGALYLQGRSSSAASSDPGAGVVATPASRYLAQVQAINDREQAAWLPAFNGFENINSSGYDQSWVVTHQAAVTGAPTIREAARQLAHLRPPKGFEAARALLVRKYRLELTLTGYVERMTVKRDGATILSLFDKVGHAGDANKAITPRVIQALQTAAANSGTPAPSWISSIQ